MKLHKIRTSIALMIFMAFLSTLGLCAESVPDLRLLAEQGRADAQVRLGRIYEDSENVPQDYQESIKWYRKAAEQGNSAGQVRLANMYDEGKGVPQDFQKATEWFRKAAEIGNIDAEFVMARDTNLAGVFYKIIKRLQSGLEKVPNRAIFPLNLNWVRCMKMAKAFHETIRQLIYFTILRQ